MKLIISFVLFSYVSAWCQTREATVAVIDASKEHGRLRMRLEVSIPNTKKEEVFLIFMVANQIQIQLNVGEFVDTRELEKNPMQWNKFRRLFETSERLDVIINTDKWKGDFIIYPVVIQGTPDDLVEIISLIDGEFDTINSVLNVIYKSRNRPLTYAEYVVK